jgi:hypothetical protein
MGGQEAGPGAVVPDPGPALDLLDIQSQAIILLRSIPEYHWLEHSRIGRWLQEGAIHQADIPKRERAGSHGQLAGAKQPARAFFLSVACGSQPRPGVGHGISCRQGVSVILGDMLHLQRPEDVLLEEVHQLLSRDFLDNRGRDDVTGIGILPLAPRREIERAAGPLLDDRLHRCVEYKSARPGEGQGTH